LNFHHEDPEEQEEVFYIFPTYSLHELHGKGIPVDKDGLGSQSYDEVNNEEATL
jgi:hypothetical protein